MLALQITFIDKASPRSRRACSPLLIFSPSTTTKVNKLHIERAKFSAAVLTVGPEDWLASCAHSFHSKRSKMWLLLCREERGWGQRHTYTHTDSATWFWIQSCEGVRTFLSWGNEWGAAQDVRDQVSGQKKHWWKWQCCVTQRRRRWNKVQPKEWKLLLSWSPQRTDVRCCTGLHSVIWPLLTGRSILGQRGITILSVCVCEGETWHWGGSILTC